MFVHVLQTRSLIGMSHHARFKLMNQWNVKGKIHLSAVVVAKTTFQKIIEQKHVKRHPGGCQHAPTIDRNNAESHGSVPGGDEQAMMDKVNMPVLLMPAGNDPENLKEGTEGIVCGFLFVVFCF